MKSYGATIYGFIRDTSRGLCARFRRRLAGNDIGRDTRISFGAYLDMTNPRGVHIGDGTLIENGVAVLAHDPTRLFHAHTYIGRNCLVGMRAFIMPGVIIGDQTIVIPGCLVNKDVPAGSIVAGNPMRVLRSGIRTGKYGVLLDADAAAPIEEAKSAGLEHASAR
jgi:acetyltransferase-like isoleucine patch superfamily enzyme